MLQNPAENAKITPMMQQFLNIKAAYNDYLLFYRMGDFYELFFEDAIQAAKTLDIVLTRRGKHMDTEIPMCGVPAHSHEFYLQKLIREGFKVAICEQTESPEEAKKRGGHKAVVERKVVRIITPGTITEENLLQANFSNYLLSISEIKNSLALAWVDISTGEFFFKTVTPENILSEVERIHPKEIIIPQNILEKDSLKPITQNFPRLISPQAKAYFDADKGSRKLKDFYELHTLDAISDFSNAEASACGALLEYISLTQIGSKPRLNFPKKIAVSESMLIDYSSLRNLEIFNSSSGNNSNSLFSILNQTRTSSGSRLFAKNLANPLLDIKKINARYDAVDFFINNQTCLNAFVSELAELPDIERILSRLYLNRATPRDISSLRSALGIIIKIQGIFEFSGKVKTPEEISNNIAALGNHFELFSTLDSAIEDFPPININEGNFIKSGYNPKLDDYRASLNNTKEILAKLQDEYRERTGITSLKIRDNNMLGMYIEVTPSHVSKITTDFIHRQTLANAVRYTSDALKEVEGKYINASNYSLNLELEIFSKLREIIISQSETLLKTASAIANFDFYAAVSNLSINNNYARPELDNSADFIIEAGRHPVVEIARRNLSNSASVSSISDFTANNTTQDSKNKLLLITGPNMSGKSTYLRQNALIAIMAQAGLFVPASKAHIGLIDKVFCRVGASDNLAKGESTFMVEMIEAANILNNATDRSLVILDEIGRGTATFDGLSIAWAMVEHLHDNIHARTFFATHYHELTSLKNTLPNLGLLTVEVKEWQGNIIYMHKVINGVAASSYGVHVGKLAGLPKNVVDRANEILATLEAKNLSISSDIISSDLPLFKPAISETDDDQLGELKNILSDIDINSTTPLQALDLLAKIKSTLSQA